MPTPSRARFAVAVAARQRSPAARTPPTGGGRGTCALTTRRGGNPLSQLSPTVVGVGLRRVDSQRLWCASVREGRRLLLFATGVALINRLLRGSTALARVVCGSSAHADEGASANASGGVGVVPLMAVVVEGGNGGVRGKCGCGRELGVREIVGLGLTVLSRFQDIVRCRW